MVETVKECKTPLNLSTDDAGHEYDIWENDSTGVDYSPGYCYEEVLGENIGDKETKSGHNSGKNFAFQREVNGENIVIGNQDATVRRTQKESMEPLTQGNAKVKGRDGQWLNATLMQGVRGLLDEIQSLKVPNSHLTTENELLQSKFDTTKLWNRELSREVEEMVETVKECKTPLNLSTDDAGHEYDIWENDRTGVDYSPGYCYEEVLGENIGDKETKSGHNSGKNFVFQDEVKGENVMVGNQVTAISSGGPMEFMDPLKNNSMLNKDAKLPTGSSGSGSDEPVKVEVDGALIGKESVNVQTNVQNVYLGGSGPTKKEEEELAEFLKENRERAAKEGNLEDLFKHENLDEFSDDLKMKAIARIARDPGTLMYAESFVTFCEKLASTQITDTKALGPHLDHISRINLTSMNPDFKVLATFFSCFESKVFDWIIIRNSTLTRSDLMSLADSLGTCQAECIEMSYCSYEFGAFDWFEFLLSHCRNVVLRGLTSPNIFQQSEGLLKRMKFSGDDAMRISECIFHVASKATTFGVDLSECDLTNLDVTSKFAVFMGEISSLSLERCSVNTKALKMIFSKINQLDWFDMRLVALRNDGLALLAPLLGKIKVLLLAGILIDENGLDWIANFLEDRGQPVMEVLDISGNIISQENIVRLLKAVGKVELIIFSHDQDVQYLNEDSDTIIRKVSGGVPYHLDDDTPIAPVTHYIAHTEHVHEQTISDYVRTITTTVFAIKPKKYSCGTCKAHVAFNQDLLQPPCVKLSKDRSIFGFFKNEDFVAVRFVYGLKESKNSSVIHYCGKTYCPLEKAVVKKVKCANCSSSVGMHYEKEGLELWILFEDFPGSMVIGNMKKVFRAMKQMFS